MPDDHQPPAPGPGAPGPAGPDRTQHFPAAADPWSDAEPAAPPEDPAATTALPGTPGPAGPDRTGALPPDETAQLPAPADGTARLPRTGAAGPVPPGATSPMPRVDDDAAPAGAVWAGRAEVRPPGPAVVPAPPVSRWESGWEPADGPAERSWLRPVLLGILALILLALLGLGLYLITRAADRGDPPAVPVPTAAPTRAPTSAAPTSAAPTRNSPTPSPTPEEPEDVVVPQLVGLAADEAARDLDELGLTYRQTFRTSDEPAGTVIETDPAQGRSLPPGARVTLVIAAAPRTTEAPPPASPSPSPTG